MWEKGNLPALLLGMQIEVAPVESSMQLKKKKKKIELPYDPAIPLLGYTQRNPKH